MQGILIMLALLLLTPAAAAEEAIAATMYKRPYCTCCDGHAEHLRANGYKVTVIEAEDLPQIKQRHGVPKSYEGCHTLLVGGYVVEGHVPATVIDRLLKERPDIKGISLPGMPEGSPGMGGTKSEPFMIYEFSERGMKLYAKE